MYPGPQYPPHYPNAMQVSSVDNTLRRQPGNITDDQRHAHMVAPPMKTSVICQTPMPGLPRYSLCPVLTQLAHTGHFAQSI